ncbi:MAG TPA: hypothetical protein VGB55_05690 [Tepidisphaeraceae bacterium]|jgi:hypothetical protein
MNSIHTPVIDSTLDPVAAAHAGNAWRHGMYARKVLVTSEDETAFVDLRDALVAEWRPNNVTAWMLVDQLAKLQWRLMRAGEAEARHLEKLQRRGLHAAAAPSHPADVAVASDAISHDSGMTRLALFQMRLERSLHRTIAQLITLKKMRRKLGGLQRTGARFKSAQAPAGASVVEKSEK